MFPKDASAQSATTCLRRARPSVDDLGQSLEPAPTIRSRPTDNQNEVLGVGTGETGTGSERRERIESIQSTHPFRLRLTAVVDGDLQMVDIYLTIRDKPRGEH